MNKDLIAFLNKQVANFGLLYMKLHNYHWLVKGRHFFNLHEKFEEYYDEVTEHFDELAERVLMLNEVPAGTLKEFLELATLKEATGNETTDGMIAAILADFEQLDKEFGEGLELAEGAGDDVSADIFTGIRAWLQKNI